MDEESTAVDVDISPAPDQLVAQEPTVDVAPSLDLVAPRGGLQHQCIVSIARRRLFGHSQPPRIGRYTIERRIGSGGMGEVYLARDEALDRKIAIKRVRSISAGAREQERLRREARALARLSHPNVVQVYEVDEHEGQTFLAMEYVDGQTLGEWLAFQPRPWRQVLETFVAAGRGMVAAHEAGLVHRDFKPDNVLLGRDGSVRVADFGLVLAGDDLRPGRDLSDEPSANPRSIAVGKVLGTIRYMSIEQLCGLDVDARSDQFSFCLSLYEALWGEPPFTLASPRARFSALEAAKPTPPRPRPGTRPPAALWRVIRRGLSRAPDDRWPDMQSLLTALQDVARRRRRLARAGLVSAALTLCAGILVHDRDEPVDPCDAIEQQLDGAWDEPRRVAFETSVAELVAEHVTHSQKRIVAGLDHWSAEWVRVRTQACRARQEHRIAPQLAQRKSACLTRQRHRVRSLVDLLAEPDIDGNIVARAVDAVAELPPPSACDDELVLLEIDPPAPGITDQVEKLRRDVDRAHELRVLGRREEALELAEQTEAAAAGLGYGPLHAEALAGLALAQAEGDSVEVALPQLEDAIDSAELSHHDYLVAELWLELALRTLIDLEQAEAGAWQLRRAEVANERVASSVRARARLAFAHGHLAELRGDRAEAERRFRAALALAKDDVSSAPDVPSYWSSLARLVSERDRSGHTAIPLHRAAYEAAEALYGPHHPQTAQSAYALGLALRDEDPSLSALLLRRAVEAWTTSHTRPYRELAMAHRLLARLALKEGDIDGAWMRARRLASIHQERLPADHRDHGEVAHLLAIIHAIRGDYEEALRQARAALARWEPLDGPDDRVVVGLHSDVSSMLLALGRIDDAAAELDAVLPHAAGTPQELPVRLHRCEVALRRGQLDAADAELRWIETNHEVSLGPHEFSYALLRALIDLRRGRLEPTTLARLHRARTDTPFTVEQIASWLDQLVLSTAERSALSFD